MPSSDSQSVDYLSSHPGDSFLSISISVSFSDVILNQLFGLPGNVSSMLNHHPDLFCVKIPFLA